MPELAQLQRLIQRQAAGALLVVRTMPEFSAFYKHRSQTCSLLEEKIRNI